MNSGESLSQFKLLHTALVIGVLLFGGVGLMIQMVLGLNFPDILPADTVYVAVFVLVALIIASNYLYKKAISGIDAQMEAEQLLSLYRSASIVRYALLEAAALLTGAGYLFTGQIVYLGLMGIATGYFIFVRPTKDKLIKELNLSYSDQHKMGLA